MDQNRLALLALHFIPGIGDYTIRQLVSYCGSAEKVFKTPKGKLLKIPGIGKITADTISNELPFKNAEKELKIAEKENTRLIFYTDKDYPYRLKLVSDAPSLLYVKGNVDFENTKSVAIVGTRKSTDYGKHRVEELVESLVAHQASIISGLAYGIDILAHKQALKKNLPTLGIMGSGIDVMYPAIHADTAQKMLTNGGLVTENPFGTKPDAHNFPARNRIIAGLCDALVVVEAAEKGGALITAEIANSYNKDVFAFPGNIGQSFSEGCNNLIKSNKAHLISSVKDLEYIMGWNAHEQLVPKKEAFNLESYEPDEQAVLKVLLLNNHQLMIDELSWRSGFPMSKLASILLGLEFKNTISTLPGKVYKLALK
ncbi:DNA-processing protein DprA [Ohtaekwangia koreensis]|uniref:DNA processing protein n=1 Tax=Ohtaekwangia koreensis TaxID=688867 RepID=A0A1T5K8X5_9BACT|nr:DNA-processing protein DprA [Ohtaekwangia koreensis]SKC59919.1 DNA processing protein [Ohtaekwangia koreensis]